MGAPGTGFEATLYNIIEKYFLLLHQCKSNFLVTYGGAYFDSYLLWFLLLCPVSHLCLQDLRRAKEGGMKTNAILEGTTNRYRYVLT